MLWNNIKHLKSADFKRLTGVKRSTFKAMAWVLEKFYRAKQLQKKKRGKKKGKGGRTHKHSVSDRLLITLMYWREYRTMFHIGVEYGMSEAAVSRTITAIENILKKSKKFELPGKKKLSSTKFSYEVFIVDATETPIQRPKKNNKNIIQARRKPIRSKLNS